jgi:hypothetical protein
VCIQAILRELGNILFIVLAAEIQSQILVSAGITSENSSRDRPDEPSARITSDQLLINVSLALFDPRTPKRYLPLAFHF